MKTHQEGLSPVEEDREQTVLIIDDDAASLGVISDYLGNAGFTVLVARNGESGIEKARYVQPDIICLDVLMPGIDGFETCRQLKSDPATADIPVIFMTALTSTEDKVRGFEIGAVDYITKPFQHKEILSRVRVQLKLRALTRELRQTNKELTKHRDRLEELVEERTTEIKSANLQLHNEITERSRSEEALQESEQRYRIIMEASLQGTYQVDAKGRITFASPATAELTGYSLAELDGLSLDALYPRGEAKAISDAHVALLYSGKPIVGENALTRKDGSRIETYFSCAPVLDESGDYTGFVGSILDITERSRAEESLRKTNRAYKALSQSNQALIRATDEEELLQEVCRIVREDCGYRLVWVGLAEHDEHKTVRPVAQAGYEEGYLETVNIVWADNERGRGPTGTAIRTRNPVVNRDVKTDPIYAPWRDEAAKRGYASSAAFPLITADMAVGALNVYAGEPGAFDPEEIQLLMELAGDLAFGIIALRQRAERERAEEALRESEERFRSLFESATEFIFVLDPHAIIVQANRATIEALGYSEDELTGQRITEFLSPESKETFAKHFPTVVETGYCRAEMSVVCKDGGFVEVDCACSSIRDDQGAISLFLLSQRDITDRKRAEGRIREQRDFLNNLLESLTHPFYVVNTDDYTISLANDAAVASGVSGGSTCYSATHGRTTPCNDWRHPCPLGQVKKTGLPTMVQHVHYGKKGEPRNIEVHAYPILDSEGTVKQIIEYCLDVTDRTQAQEALRENERTLTTILSLSLSGISYFPEGKLTWTNKAMMELFGYDEDEKGELLGKGAHEFYESEEEYRRVRDIFRAQIAEGRPAEAEARFRTKDGSIFIGNVSVSAGSPDSAVQGTTVVISDVTSRKMAEEERLRLMTAIEQAAETIVITDQDGTIQYVNPSFETITGYAREEAIGQNPRILQSGEHDEEFYKKMWETLTRGDTWRGHLVNKKKDGKLLEEEATISPVRDESGNIVNYVAVKRDVTDQVLLEKQLYQAQKMESIGTLAGGIAHDFNNILQVVLGYADMLTMSKGKSSPDLPNLETIRKAAKDGGELVKGLLTFSRQVESKLRPCNLNLKLKRSQKILRRTIPRMIDIELFLADDLKTVNADPIQGEQVLMNLAVNAQHSMPKGGNLTIETRNVTLGDDYCRTHVDAKPGENVQLKISDTGRGIEKEVMEHIFEPFFTTKEAGQGTGLGLSIVYGIVKNHGGHITCSSEPGQGTTFTMYLPALPGAAELDPAMTAGDMPAFGTETILLVDDDARVIEMGEQMLMRRGYKVFTAENGAEALEIYRERKDEIDLVVLDLIMPEMGGEQCLEEILKLDPTAKVLIASGYLASRTTNGDTEGGAGGFIAKPFDTREFLRVVREVLDKTDSPGSRTGGSGPTPTQTSPLAEGVLRHETPDIHDFPGTLRILVIDDRQRFLTACKVGLAQFGHTPLTAISGIEGLQLFQESPVDLVICDLEMPELSGWDVGKKIQEICRKKAIPKTPFVLLTGQADMEDIPEEDREKMADCGVDAIVGKPIDIPDLLKIAEPLIKRRQQDPE